MKAARILSDSAFRALVRAAGARRGRTAPRDRFLIYLLGKTGLRISEALSLTVGDLWLDQDPAFLRVRTLKQRRGRRADEILLDRPTAVEARRYVRQTLPALRCGRRRLADLDAAGAGAPLFPAIRGARGRRRGTAPPAMSRHNAKAIFRTYVRLANVSPSITLHSLRHYRGTVLMRTTGDLEFTREQLRHSDARSVQTYLHTDPERRDRYLRQLERQDVGGGPDA